MALTEERLRRQPPAPVAPPTLEPQAARAVPEQDALSYDAVVPEGSSERRFLIPAPALLVAWIVGVGALFALAPVPDEATVPLWSALVSTSFMLALFATVTGLASRAGWARRASTVTAGAGLALAVACAASGHHAGLWWAAEAVVFGALLALTRARAAGG